MKKEDIKPAIHREYALDDRDDKAMYDDMLNECNDVIKIGYLTFDASRIVEVLDPIAYRCGFNDYVDSLDDRWECPECGKIHDEEDKARNCCQEEDDEQKQQIKTLKQELKNVPILRSPIH